MQLCLWSSGCSYLLIHRAPTCPQAAFSSIRKLFVPLDCCKLLSSIWSPGRCYFTYPKWVNKQNPFPSEHPLRPEYSKIKQNLHKGLKKFPVILNTNPHHKKRLTTLIISVSRYACRHFASQLPAWVVFCRLHIATKAGDSRHWLVCQAVIQT